MKSMDSLHRSYAAAKFLTYFFLILGALIMVFPFAWMILTSSKTVAESLRHGGPRQGEHDLIEGLPLVAPVQIGGLAHLVGDAHVGLAQEEHALLRHQ